MFKKRCRFDIIIYYLKHEEDKYGKKKPGSHKYCYDFMTQVEKVELRSVHTTRLSAPLTLQL